MLQLGIDELLLDALFDFGGKTELVVHAFVLVHELVEAALRVLEPVGLLEAASCLLV